mgnify:CR=1 FL=1
MSDQTTVEPKIIEAFYIVPKSGGFQTHKVTIKDGDVYSDKLFGDLDAWDPVMNSLEYELSSRFQ